MRIIIVYFISFFTLCLLNNCNKEKGDSSSITPTAHFSMNKPVVKKGEAIQFINKSQNASFYIWDFGDGNSSNELNPSHTYTNSGTYKVSLTAKNDAGTSTYFGNPFIKDITVMTYNIAFSGGAVDFLYDMWQKDGHGAWNHDRRSELLKIIRSASPDILGIQEAYCWDSYNPKVYERFADSLGMKYYYYPGYVEAEWNGICIFSKFPLESTGFLLHQPCTPNQVVNGTFTVKVVVRIDNDKTIDVLVCHFISQAINVTATTACEVEALQNTFINYLNNTILMGDMNAATGPSYTQKFRNSGLSSSDIHQIDQIWASNKLFEKSKTISYYDKPDYLSLNILELLSTASDHKPVITHFAF